jgi:hypothetical protein
MVDYANGLGFCGDQLRIPIVIAGRGVLSLLRGGELGPVREEPGAGGRTRGFVSDYRSSP